MRGFQWLVISLIVLALLGCSGLDGSRCDAEAYIASAEDLFDEWDDAVALANSTPRVSLAPVISQLQEIKRRATDLAVPECAQGTHSVLVDMMEAAIDGFLKFNAEEPEVAVAAAFERYQAQQFEFVRRFALLKSGDDPDVATATAEPTSTPRPTNTVAPSATRGPTRTPAPTRTPMPTATVRINPVEVNDGALVLLPTSLLVIPQGTKTDVEVVAIPDGVISDCRLPGGITVQAMEATIFRTLVYVRIEGSPCDGWVRDVRLGKVP